MTSETTIRIEGMIVQRFKPGKAGKYVVHDFKVKTDNGETYTVRKFFDFDNELIGKRVSLEASVSQYNGKEYYNVAKGTEIEVVGEGNHAQPPEPIAPTATAVRPKVQTRASKVATPSVTPVKSVSANISEDLEEVRAQVESIITKDVEFCTFLLGGKTSKDAVAQLVSAFQATRATLVIQASQRRRGL